MTALRFFANCAEICRQEKSFHQDVRVQRNQSITSFETVDRCNHLSENNRKWGQYLEDVYVWPELRVGKGVHVYLRAESLLGFASFEVVGYDVNLVGPAASPSLSASRSSRRRAKSRPRFSTTATTLNNRSFISTKDTYRRTSNSRGPISSTR